MKEKRAAIWKRILAVVLTAALLPIGGVQTARAAETVSIQVENRQTDGPSLMNMVNTYRTSQTQTVSGSAVTVSPLAYDYGLELSAMQRAAEVALVYSNQMRPDNTAVSTAYNYGGTCVESIGTGSISDVYTGWITSTTDRANMVNAAYTVMGVGHVVYNGRDYWAAAFSNQATGVPQTSLGSPQQKQISVGAIQQKKVETGLASTLSMNVGDTASFANARAAVPGV